MINKTSIDNNIISKNKTAKVIEFIFWSVVMVMFAIPSYEVVKKSHSQGSMSYWITSVLIFAFVSALMFTFSSMPHAKLITKRKWDVLYFIIALKILSTFAYLAYLINYDFETPLIVLAYADMYMFFPAAMVCAILHILPCSIVLMNFIILFIYIGISKLLSGSYNVIHRLKNPKN